MATNKENQFRSEFQKSGTSYGYNQFQRRAADDTKKAQQRTTELVRDARTKQAETQAKYSADSAQLRAAQAAANSKWESLKGIASAAGTLASGVSRISQMEEQRRKEEEAEAKRQQAIAEANGVLFGSGGSVVVNGKDGKVNAVAPSENNPEVVQTETENENDQDAQDAAVRGGAVEALPDDEDAQEVIGGAAGDNNAGRAMGRTNVNTAALGVDAFIKDGMQDGTIQIRLADGRIISPLEASSAQEIQEVALALAREYARRNGITAGESTVKVFVPAVLSAVARATNNLSGERRGVKQDDRIAVHDEAMATGIDAGQDLATTWTRLSNGYWTSGKFGSRREANEVAMTKLLEYLAATGNVDAIDELAATPKMKGGPTLDKQYGTLIAKARQMAQRTRSSNRRLADEDAQNSVKEAANTFQEALQRAQTPEEVRRAHEAYEAQLRALGDAGRDELRKQQTIPNSRNPWVYTDLSDRVANGQEVSDTEIDELVRTNVITIEQGRALKQQRGVSSETTNAALKPLQPAVKGIVKGAVSQGLTSAGVPVEAQRGQGAAIALDLQTRLNAFLRSRLKEQPDLTQGQLLELSQKWMADNGAKLMEGVKWDPESGSIQGYTFAGAGASTNPQQATGRVFTNPVTGRESVAVTGLTSAQIRDIQTDTNKDNDIDPTTDRVLTTSEMQGALDAIATGDLNGVPERVKQIAEALGYTPQALVIAQAKAQGLPKAEEIERTVLTGQEISGGYGTTPAAGEPGTMNHMVNSFTKLGFTRKAAEYLAANAAQESGLNGQRAPWVLDDGAGTNKGLMSWNRDRITRIESKFGKSIETMSNEEQAAAIKWELQNYYPGAYRIFSNPRATDAQLRRASYQYLGWGEEGDRFGTHLDAAKGVSTMSSTATPITSATSQMYGMDTSAGPDNGNNACVWAVNKVLKAAGITPPWGNSLYVPTAKATLDQQGAQLSGPEPGAIVIFQDNGNPPYPHIGIVQADGSIISNSSGSASFNWVASEQAYTNYYGRKPLYYRV